MDGSFVFVFGVGLAIGTLLWLIYSPPYLEKRTMVAYREMSDEELLLELRRLDDGDGLGVTPWEADFLESVLFERSHGPLSDKQRDKAIEILEEYT